MDFKKCNRCGCFFVSEGDVCPKCSPKDKCEMSTLKDYVTENGFSNSLETISGETGISTKNLNRFLGYSEFKNYKKEFKNLL